MTAYSCLITARVSAPCAVCLQYSDKTHVYEDSVSIGFYCSEHCPVHGQPHLSGEVVTTQGQQQSLFGG